MSLHQQIAEAEGWEYDELCLYFDVKPNFRPRLLISEREAAFRFIEEYHINVEYYSQHGPVVGWRATHYCDEHCIELFDEDLITAVFKAVLAIKEGEG